MFNKKESLLGSLVSFIFNPIYDEQVSQKPFYLKAFDMIRILAIQATFVAIFLFFILTLNSIFKLNPGNNSVANFLENSSIFYIILTAVILAPLTEEIAFRLGLRLTKLNVAISLSALLIIFFDLLKKYLLTFLPGWLFGIGTPLGFLSYVLFMIFCSFFLFAIFQALHINFTFLKKHFRIVYYLSVLAFGLVHITNYNNLGTLIIFTPVLIAPQLFAGFTFGYLRFKNGLKWSVFAHSIYNGILTLPYIALGLRSSPFGTPIILLVALIFLGILGLALVLNLQLIIEWIIVQRENSRVK